MQRVRAILMLVGFIGVAVFGGSAPAFAGVSAADNPGGTVTVGASFGGSSGGATGTAANGGATDGGGSAPVCTYSALTLNDLGAAPGGPTPGGWYLMTCVGSGGAGVTTEDVWIPDSAQETTTPAVDPRIVALQAESMLRLPSPAMHFNPTGSAVTNLPTWLWIDPGQWSPYVVSATVGSVTATATAIPVFVVWSMGDGGSATCGGPGTPYRLNLPSASQQTACSYTYPVTSFGQLSLHAGADDEAFQVTATIEWHVSWAASGAPGGGVLPDLATESNVDLRVEQVQSINSETEFDAGSRASSGEVIS